MNEWPAPRWGHPLPPWTKIEFQRAKTWLVIVVIFVLVGMLFAYIRGLLIDPNIEKFKYFHDIDNFYSVALKTALDEKSDAMLARIVIWGEESLYDDDINYQARLYFCSPSDSTWLLHLRARRKFRVIGKDVELTRVNYIPSSIANEYSGDCESHAIDSSYYDPHIAVESMLSSLDNSRVQHLEKYPRWMELSKQDGLGHSWKGLFYFLFSSRGLRITIDYDTGELISVEELEFTSN